MYKSWAILVVTATNKTLPPLFPHNPEIFANQSSDCCHDYGSPKITQLDLTLLGDQDVLWLHVTVKDSPVVQIEEGRDKLAGNDLNLHRKWGGQGRGGASTSLCVMNTQYDYH